MCEKPFLYPPEDEYERRQARNGGDRGMTSQEHAVILLSGGLDSATVAAIAKEEGFFLHALSFNYGQRHVVEIEAARRVASTLGIDDHVTVAMDLTVFGGSALTDSIPVPKHDAVADLDETIPVTYVPARNTIFLSYALGFAEVRGARHIFLGVNALDYSGYPDCRPEFISAFAAMANLATKAAVEGDERWEIHTPLIEFSKSQIIQHGLSLGVDYSLTHSCYDPDNSGQPCRHCDSCLLRQKGFDELGVDDPALSGRERSDKE
jgi:7-cyano-7-deazaguanine synthase